MRKLVLIIALGSAAACIEWPSEGVIRERRCSADPTDQGCTIDAGSDGGTDAGVGDAGEDGGDDAGATDGGLDAGGWTIAWREVANFEARFLVGDSAGGTLVSQTATSYSLRGVDSLGATQAAITLSQARTPTAAYEDRGIVVVALDNGDLGLWRREAMMFSQIAMRTGASFVTTAVDLYPHPSDGGPAVAAYGNQDGGLGLDSFTAETFPMSVGSVVVPCDTTALRPRRIRPTPDGGPGVVVGNVVGSCFGGLQFSADAGGGFVGRFGFPVQDGYSFEADPESPMALDVVENDLWIAFQTAGTSGLSVAKVRPTGPLVGLPVLVGRLTPVELVDIGNDYLLVGHGSGVISLPDGGAPVQMNGSDVFIARLNVARGILGFDVFVAPGDQSVAGALWTNNRLVMGGSCSGPVNAGLCADAGPGQSWLGGFASTL